MTEKRLLILVGFMLSFAFMLQLSMVRIVCGDYHKKALRQTVKSVEISAGRADITDCNLNRITGTENSLKVLITPQTNLQDIFENIREKDREKFYKKIQNETKVVVDLEKPVEADAIYAVSKRYADRNIAQHLIGYTDSTGKGLTGIERAFDSRLSGAGEKIKLFFNVNGNGEIYGDIWTESSDSRQVLALTIDNSIQRLAESIAAESLTDGSIVIMESRTGKIKAMASVPVYNANNVAAFLQRENSPLVNKALSVYEPGSVVKPLWAAALLEVGYNPNKIYECKGYTEVNNHIYHCANHRAHGEVDMEKALVVSCNCYFIDRYVKNKGELMVQMANQMNFGRRLALCENYYTNQGTFPDEIALANIGQLSSVSFGQGDFLVSPVHIAAYMNIFANDGVYVYPAAVQGIYDEKTGNAKEILYDYKSKRVISSQTAQAVKDMLVQVVHQGAGGRARPENLTAAGKTGTAQTGKYNENGEEIFTAWFCGFYPADNPEYVICITMYNGGESTYTAAPVFRQVCDGLYYLKYA